MGRVHGLDVAHTINKRPIQDEEYKGPPLQPHPPGFPPSQGGT